MRWIALGLLGPSLADAVGWISLRWFTAAWIAQGLTGAVLANTGGWISLRWATHACYLQRLLHGHTL